MSLIRRIISAILGLLGLIYAIYFSVNNLETILVKLPFLGEYTVPAFVAFLGAFLVGVVVTFAYSSVEHLRKSMQLRKLRREVNGTRRQPHKRVRRFLKEEEPVTLPEPSVQGIDSKDF